MRLVTDWLHDDGAAVALHPGGEVSPAQGYDATATGGTGERKIIDLTLRHGRGRR
jgi:hypothetical protein